MGKFQLDQFNRNPQSIPNFKRDSFLLLKHLNTLGVRSLTELLFPSRCIACSKLGISICLDCERSWQPSIYKKELITPNGTYPVLSAIPYSEIASKIILSSKENNLSVADQLIAAAISPTVKYFCDQYGTGVLVPIPSRKSAIRKRGRNFLMEILEKVAQDNSLKITPLLFHVRAVQDQSKLNQSQRRINITDALSADSKNQVRKFRENIEPVILVDDLMTTGSTLVEAVRALHSAGYEVKGAVTCAFAQPLR